MEEAAKLNSTRVNELFDECLVPISSDPAMSSDPGITIVSGITSIFCMDNILIKRHRRDIYKLLHELPPPIH